MDVVKTAVAGTLESSDVMVTIGPNDNGIEIVLNSTVEKQFGQEIRNTVANTLMQLGIERATVKVVDKGALDCVIVARTRTSAYRAAECDDYRWGFAQ